MASLRDIAIGSSAEVALVAGGDPTAERLLEMGITPGVRVRVVGAAPLGCPVELEVRGYRLSIRKSDAARIAVSPTPEAASRAAGRRPAPR
jgi:ferrous iron transport protein A